MLPQLSIFVLFSYVCSSSIAKPSSSFSLGEKTINTHFIIGGRNAFPGAWPWQLSLQYNNGLSWNHFCGAVLIRATGALTAAHCVEGELPGSLRVVAGLHDRNDLSNTEVRSLTKYTMHPLYNSEDLFNDIATLELSQPIGANGMSIAYARLPTDDSNDWTRTKCVITGWGRTSHSPSDPLADILQQVSLNNVATLECNRLLSDLGGITVDSTQLCAYDTLQQKGGCNGDSGGPMNCPTDTGYIVAGVASWVISSHNYNCYTEYPTAYTRIGAFLEWISEN